MAEEEIGSKEQAPKSNRILFCYFFIVLLLGLVAIGILVRAFDTAFVERETWMKVAESQKRPNRLIYPSRGNIYSSDGKLMATSVPCFICISISTQIAIPIRPRSGTAWIRF